METEVYSMDESAPSGVSGAVRGSTRSAWLTVSDFDYVGGLGSALGYRLNYQSRLNVNDEGINGNSIIAGVPGGGHLAFPEDSSSSSSSSSSSGGMAETVYWVRAGRSMQIFDWDGSRYAARYGVKTLLAYDALSDEFTLTRRNGARSVFYGHSGGPSGGGGGGSSSSSSSSGGGAGAPPGSLSKMFTPGGGETEATYQNGKLDTLQRSRGSGASLDASALHFSYDGSGKRSQVLHKLTKAGATDDVRKVTYTYYGASDDGGLAGDLSTTHVQSWDVGIQDWIDRGKRCFRYYTAAGTDGFGHGLKYFLGPEMYKQIASVHGPPEDMGMETEDEEALEAFSNYFFKYDPATKRVKHIRRKG